MRRREDCNLDKGAYYIRFGSLAHRILLVAKDNKYIHQSMLEEELEVGTAWISKMLQSLTKRGFLYKAGKEKHPNGPHYHLWSLAPIRTAVRVKPLTNAEKCRYWRERKKMKVATVFNFRGRIEL